MKIEKLKPIERSESGLIKLPSIESINDKINELIDALNETEQNRSEQMARVVDKQMRLENRVIELETQMSRCIDYLNENENRVKELENANQQTKEPKDPEISGCPWCASKDIKFIDFGFNNPSYRGECMNCHAHNAPSKTKQESIMAWNKRAN